MVIVRGGIWSQRRVILVKYERHRYIYTEKSELMKKENMLIFWCFSCPSSHFTYSSSLPLSVALHPSTPRPHVRGPSFTDSPEA